MNNNAEIFIEDIEKMIETQNEIIKKYEFDKIYFVGDPFSKYFKNDSMQVKKTLFIPTMTLNILIERNIINVKEYINGYFAGIKFERISFEQFKEIIITEFVDFVEDKILGGKFCD